MSTREQTCESLIGAAQDLATGVSDLSFDYPVAHVYNPLVYAWRGYSQYLRKFAGNHKRVVFLGMNPGPFGMVQTGVPFGDVSSVKQWLGINAEIRPPTQVHPKRPILGFGCPRCEISGQRLWSLFRQRFGSAEVFFAEHLVLNYCPLAFIESTGRNRTPDKLASLERQALYSLCDAHLNRAIAALRPEWLIGIGGFAAERAGDLFAGAGIRLGQILHPSPASPLANRNWAQTAERQLRELGVWS